MSTQKTIAMFAVLCLIALGLGYWVGQPKESSGKENAGNPEGKEAGKNEAAPKEPEFLKKGLVAYYPFNGNAKDESGNGNDGEVKGATSTDGRNGKSEKACYFDGHLDYIDIKHSDTVSFHWSDFTISIWLRYPRQHEDKGAAVFQKNILNKPYPGVNIFAGTAVRFRIIGYPNGLISNKTGLDNNTWNHFIFVKKEDKKTIYINGRLAAEQNSPLENAQRNIENIRLGANLHNMSKQNFIGAMDDLRIYNRALSEAEVKELCDFEKAK